MLSLWSCKWLQFRCNCTNNEEHGHEVVCLGEKCILALDSWHMHSLTYNSLTNNQQPSNIWIALQSEWVDLSVFWHHKDWRQVLNGNFVQQPLEWLLRQTTAHSKRCLSGLVDLMPHPTLQYQQYTFFTQLTLSSIVSLHYSLIQQHTNSSLEIFISKEFN